MLAAELGNPISVEPDRGKLWLILKAGIRIDDEQSKVLSVLKRKRAAGEVAEFIMTFISTGC